MAYNKLSKYKTKVTEEGTKVTVRYHNTNIVVADVGYIRLDSGGWMSVTTKRKMNQASQQFMLGYHVWQKKFIWYVTYRYDGDYRTEEYYDGMVL